MTAKYYSLFLFLLTTVSATAQTAQWKHIQQGNRAFEHKDYAKAELNYMNALKAAPASQQVLFNLGNVQLGKGNAQAALDYFNRAGQNATDTLLSAMTHHNQGYVYHASAMSSTKEDERQRALRTAIEYYKQALRLNPADDNTRYNLALCQKLLKEEQTQQEQQQQQQQEQQRQQEQQQQQQQQEQPQKDDKQTQQLLNLARQAEKRAKEKVDKAMKNRRTKSLEKNW